MEDASFNKNSLPAFTAENSLIQNYKSYYHVTQKLDSSESVYPAMFDTKCYSLCLERCHPGNEECPNKCKQICSNCSTCKWVVGSDGAECVTRCPIGQFQCQFPSGCADLPCPPGFCDCYGIHCAGRVINEPPYCACIN